MQTIHDISCYFLSLFLLAQAHFCSTARERNTPS